MIDAPKNGNAMMFRLSYTDKGVSPYSLLEAAWLLPGLIYGLKTKIWEWKPNEAEMPHPILRLWVEMGLLTAIPNQGGNILLKLTPTGETIVQMGGLLEYEYSMMDQQLRGNRTTDPEKYAGLRDSLSKYSAIYNTALYDWIETMLGGDDVKEVIDVGGGSGYSLVEILKMFPDANGVLYDKDANPGYIHRQSDELQKRIDFASENLLKRSPALAKMAGKFDIVIASELLHCFGPEELDFVLPKLARLLSPTGKLLIIEQRATFRLDWRLWDMTNGGRSLDAGDVYEIMQIRPQLGLELVDQAIAATHHISMYQPMEVKHATIN